MRSVRSGFSHLLILITLVGCATGPAERDPTKSLALQVMEAADRDQGLRDVSAEQMEEALGQPLNDDWVYTADVGLTATGALTPPPGFSGGGATAMSVLGLFVNSSIREADISQLIVWMPRSLAPDEKAAAPVMGRILEQAVIEALPDGYDSRLFEWTDVASIGKQSHFRVIKEVDGPLCPEWSCVVKGPLVTDTQLTWMGDTGKSIAPEFVTDGPYEAYSYKGYEWAEIYKITKEFDKQGRGHGRWHKIETADIEGFDYRAFYTRLSDALPEWAYYYQSSYKSKRVSPIFPVPLILSQGRALFFVKP